MTDTLEYTSGAASLFASHARQVPEPPTQQSQSYEEINARLAANWKHMQELLDEQDENIKKIA